MKVDILGCRGSTPADGAEFSRYGGATSCVTLTEGTSDPSLILDAGTGIRRLGRICQQPFRGTLMFSHLHWDHIQGLPFTAALDHPDSEVDILVPHGELSAEDAIARFMSPPTFPIGPSGLRGRWTFRSLKPGTRQIGAWEVETFDVDHKGGRTFGFRIDGDRASIAYIPDHAPGAPGSGPDGLGTLDRQLIGVLEGVDVLLHDGQHLDSEYPARSYLGHSSIGYARSLARAADGGRLVLFHHDPNRTDDELDAIATTLDPSTSLAVQDTVIVPGRTGDS